MGQSRWIIRDCGLDEQTLLKNESIFSVVNGYLGVRGNFEEGYGGLPATIRGAYINGCYDITDIMYDERLYGFPESKQTIVNIHDFQTIYLSVGDETFDISAGNIISFDRTLDMKNGVYKRSIDWESPKGKQLRIEITRMASFAVKELFTIDYTVTPLNFDGDICFVSEGLADVANYSDGEDPRTGSRKGKSLKFIYGGIEEGVIYLESQTAHSKITVGTCISHTLSKEGKFDFLLSGMKASAAARTFAAANEQIRLVKYVFCLDSPGCKDIRKRAFELTGQYTGTIDALYKKQSEFLERQWNTADITVDSDDGADLSLRYCVYQLICQGALSGGSIPAKGLSGEGYEGHYFWDTEIFIQPFFALTDPAAAKRQLLYRCSTLGAARENARILGHKRGAAYPWRTISGSECSTFFPAGAAQYHINADIAYAIINYYCITGDESFLLREGAEIIFETARLWLELGHFYNGKFRIDTITGPDEYTCLVNNNYYTNMTARHNLKWAAEIYKMLMELGDESVMGKIGLKQSEVEEFEAAYGNMYLPYDEETGITPQDDSFLSKKRWNFESTSQDDFPLLLHYHPITLYRYQVCKQADVLLAYYLFQKDHNKDVMKRSYDYYENITTHDSSLSACIFSIMAARLGDTGKGYEYFKKTLRVDLDNTHQNTKDGLHMANMGGAYLCVLGGFAGLVIDEEGASLSPVLPDIWRSYRFRFIYRGSLFEVSVKKDGTEITRAAGVPQNIKLNGVEKVY